MATISADDILSVEPPAEEADQPGGLTVQDRISDLAKRYNVPPDLALRIGRQESNFQHIDPETGKPKVSKRGAIGMFQLLPGTAGDLGGDPYDEAQNMDMGVRYIKQMLDRYDGNQRTAAGAYNAGFGTIDRNGGVVPNYPETQNYVRGLPDGPGTTPPPSAAKPDGSPTLYAQATTPPPGPLRRFSGPVRTAPGAEAGGVRPEPSYDPVYGDPVLGPDTFGSAVMLHKFGLATVSPTEDWISADGKQKVTARQVDSPDAAQTGLWTTEGRKLDPKQHWLRVGLGGGGAGGAGGPGGIKDLQHFTIRKRSTGLTQELWGDPVTGETWEIPGAMATGGQGPFRYMYNRETGKSDMYAEGALNPEEGTGQMLTASGQHLEPTATPMEVAQERRRAMDEKEKEYLRLHDRVATMKTMVGSKELGAMLVSFGVPVPANYKDVKQAHFDAIRRYEIEHGNEIEKHYQEYENMIQRDWEHRTPTAPAQKQEQPSGPQGTGTGGTQAKTGAGQQGGRGGTQPKKKVQVTGGDILKIKPR